jgi:hypothetical protein
MMMNDNLTLEESDLAGAFYDAAVDFPKATFEEVKARVFASQGFSSKALEDECRKMFELARTGLRSNAPKGPGSG